MFSGQMLNWFGVQVGAGSCLTSVKVPPIESMVKAERLGGFWGVGEFDPRLATNTKVPVLSMAMAEGFRPVGTGVDGKGVPVVEEKDATVRLPDFSLTYWETPPDVWLAQVLRSSAAQPESRI